jgi:hypothetical protein
MKTLWNKAKRGGVLVYATVTVPVILSLAIFSVDFGRVQVAKSEIQAAADSAVRAAGQKMADGADVPTILAAAVGAASHNQIDGQPVKVRAADILIGVYDSDRRVFVPTNDPTMANAIRVSLRHEFGKDGPPLTFAHNTSGGVKSVVHRATVMVGDTPTEWTKVRESYDVITRGKDPDEIVTEESINEYWRLVREEQERKTREEETRRQQEWEAEQRRILDERDRAERANPTLKEERLERERIEREHYEQWLREEEIRRKTEVKEGNEWEKKETIEREREEREDARKRKKVTQIE